MPYIATVNPQKVSDNDEKGIVCSPTNVIIKIIIQNFYNNIFYFKINTNKIFLQSAITQTY